MPNKYSQKKVATALVTDAPKSLVIEQPTSFTLAVEIRGTMLVMNNFSQKSVEQLLREHMGLSTVKEKKKPKDCIEYATIRNVNEEICIPSIWLKKAICAAAVGKGKGVYKSRLQTQLFIIGGSIPITYREQVPRMDIVRVGRSGNKVPDVRFRPQFNEWCARFVVRYPEQLAPQTVVDLIHSAGRAGLGEGRPSKGGEWGTFEVSRVIEDPKELAEVIDICTPPIKPLIIPDWALEMEIDPELLAKIMKSQNVESENEDEVEAAEA